MAIERVVDLSQEAPSPESSPLADLDAPAQQRSNRKRRRQQSKETFSTTTSSDTRSNPIVSAAKSQASECTHKRARTSGFEPTAAPNPENVIVIDDDDDDDGDGEAEQEAATPAPTCNSTRRSRSSASNRDHPLSGSTQTNVSSATNRTSTTAEMERLDSDDYFEVLGLTRAATDVEVKKAYRKLAIQWHPDKNRGNPRAEEYFKRVAEAYEVLSDPEKRRQYEYFGKPGASDNSGSGFAGSSPEFHHHFSSRHARDIFEAFFGGANPFEAFFGGGSTRPGARHARPAQHHPMDEYSFGFGMQPSMMMMGGGFGGGFGGSSRRNGGGGGLMDPFFGEDFDGGLGGFPGGGGGMGFSSQSVSSSTFTDRNGHVVTTKTTTTATADGRTETVTEEFRNGKLTGSNAGSSRLAGAGRMQLDSGSGRRSSRSGRLQ